MKKITFISVIAKEWFDRTYGNSYFSAQIKVNDETIYLPFQYGYDIAYVQAAHSALVKAGYDAGDNWNIQKSFREQNIPATFHKDEKCLQRDVKAWGKA